MKNFLIYIFVVLLFLSACSGDVIKESQNKEVVVYTSVDQHIAEEILNDFENETGIKVLPVYDIEASKTTGLANRLISEKDNPQGDVFWSSEIIMTLKLKEEGVFQPYISEEARNIPKSYKDNEGYWTGFGGRARVMIVNKNILGNEKYPNSVYDLTNEEYKDYKKAVAYPMFGTTLTHLYVMSQNWSIDEAVQYFVDAQENNTLIVDGNSVVRDLVASGEVAFGITDTDDAFAAVKDGKPVEVIYLDQDGIGTLVIPNTVGLINQCTNTEEGKIFIDYILKKETEDKLIKMGFIDISLNNDKKDLEFLECDFQMAYENNDELLEEIQNALVR
jgi:iron(III) transport system substrate-binding protein